MDIIISSWLGYIVAAIVSLASIFMYRRQEKQKRELENMAQQIRNESTSNDEWRKLVDERNQECKRLNEKIERMWEGKHEMQNKHDEEIADLRKKLESSLENDAKCAMYAGLYHSSRCDVYSCPKRKPPLEDALTKKFTEVELNEK